MSTNGISGDWFQPTEQPQKSQHNPPFANADELIGQVFKGFKITGRMSNDYIDKRGTVIPRLSAICDCGVRFSLLPFITPSCIGCRFCTEALIGVGVHIGDFVVSAHTTKQNTRGREVPALLLNCRTCRRALTKTVHNVVQAWRKDEADICHGCRGSSV